MAENGRTCAFYACTRLAGGTYVEVDVASCDDLARQGMWPGMETCNWSFCSWRGGPSLQTRLPMIGHFSLTTPCKRAVPKVWLGSSMPLLPHTYPCHHVRTSSLVTRTVTGSCFTPPFHLSRWVQSSILFNENKCTVLARGWSGDSGIKLHLAKTGLEVVRFSLKVEDSDNKMG